MPRLAVALLTLAVAVPALGGAPADDTAAKHLRATRTPFAPRLDGRLDEPAWAEAQVAADFTQRYPDEGTAPTERTEVRVLFDDAALYVGVRCFDRQPGKLARLVSRRDSVPESDSVTVSIDSLHDHTTGRSFTVNAAGVQADAMLYNDTETSADWDAVWDAAVLADEAGWTAEARHLAIPWRALAYSRGQRVFGFDVSRNLYKTKEVAAWVYTPRSQKAGVSRFGHLEVTHGLASPTSVELAPWAGAHLGREAAELRYGGSVGLDLRYGLTPDLRLDVTANPDFGQVEADAAVLNLTTIELTFPEKRSFFLEGAHLFQPPGQMTAMQLFYSRRIGLSPGSPELLDDERLVGAPPPAPIAGAAKLTGQIARGWNVAALEAVTLPTHATLERSDGTRESLRVAPTTNFAVVRAARDVPYGTVGATVTSVRPFESSLTRCPTGDEPVDGRCARGAETLGLDLRLRPGEYLVAAQLLASRIAQGFELHKADGTDIGKGDLGLGAQLRLARESGENLLFALQAEYATPKLDLNQAGYLERQNSFFQWGRAVLRTLQPHGPMREGQLILDVRARQTAGGQRLWEGARLTADATFTNFWYVNLGADLTGPQWDPRELRDGGYLWRPPCLFGWLWASTDARKPVYVEGEIFGGVGLSEALGPVRDLGGDAKVVVRPAPRWETSLAFIFERALDAMRFIDTTTDPASGRNLYLLAPVETRLFSLTLRQMVALTPRLVLQAYGQLFFASGRTRSSFTAPAGKGVFVEPGGPVPDPTAANGPWFHDTRLNLTVALRWEYLPGSTAYLVYQRAQVEDADDPANGIAPLRDMRILGAGRTDDRVMLKVSWWLGV